MVISVFPAAAIFSAVSLLHRAWGVVAKAQRLVSVRRVVLLAGDGDERGDGRRTACHAGLRPDLTV